MKGAGPLAPRLSLSKTYIFGFPLKGASPLSWKRSVKQGLKSLCKLIRLPLLGEMSTKRTKGSPADRSCRRKATDEVGIQSFTGTPCKPQEPPHPSRPAASPPSPQGEGLNSPCQPSRPPCVRSDSSVKGNVRAADKKVPPAEQAGLAQAKTEGLSIKSACFANQVV